MWVKRLCSQPRACKTTLSSFRLKKSLVGKHTLAANLCGWVNPNWKQPHRIRVDASITHAVSACLESCGLCLELYTDASVRQLGSNSTVSPWRGSVLNNVLSVQEGPTPYPCIFHFIYLIFTFRALLKCLFRADPSSLGRIPFGQNRTPRSLSCSPMTCQIQFSLALS